MLLFRYRYTKAILIIKKIEIGNVLLYSRITDEVCRQQSPPCGKDLIVEESRWTLNGIEHKSYHYRQSEERFERTIKTVYKISIHDKSYRDKDGKVRKKQYHLANMKYYDIIDYGWYTCLNEGRIYEIADSMDIDPDILWEEIADKLDSLSDKINAEFEQTDEYKEKKRQEAIIKKYNKKKSEFAKKYGVDEKEYDCCFDVFGELRDTKYFEKIKSEAKAKSGYKEGGSSYYEDYKSNYRGYAGVYLESGYSEKEKEYLKKFYRSLAAKYHPDVTGETETMQFINKLKEQWGV